jgi:AraC-like DNA-binding protein
MGTILSSVAVIVFLLALSFENKLGGKTRKELRLIRLLSCITGGLLAAGCLLPGTQKGIPEVIAGIVVADTLLMLYPCSFEKASASLRVSVILSACVLAGYLYFRLLPPGHMRFRHESSITCIMLLVSVFMGYSVANTVRKFKSIRMLFRNTAVWQNIEEYSRLIYSLVFLALLIFGLCAVRIPGNLGIVLSSLAAVLLLALYCILYARCLTGRTFVITKEAEQKVKHLIRGDLRSGTSGKMDEDGRMNSMYARITNYMNEKKPYLDPTFDMAEMSRQMYSNKLYLSKTVNLMSGRNFRQYVNYHRIQYALGLMRQDPRLKVSEVAEMSGFHSVVSFNMAFKLNMGQTPSDWLRDYVASRML